MSRQPLNAIATYKLALLTLAIGAKKDIEHKWIRCQVGYYYPMGVLLF